MATEVYDITTDLSDQDIYVDVLHDDANDAGLPGLNHVSARPAGQSNKVIFDFAAPLSGPDKTTLDGVVSAYDPNDGVEGAIRETKTFTIHGGPVVVATLEGQAWPVPYDIEIIEVHLMALEAITAGTYTFEIRCGSAIATPASLPLVTTIALDFTTDDQLKTVSSLTFLAAKGDYAFPIVTAIGTQPSTGSAGNMMIRLGYKKL